LKAKKILLVESKSLDAMAEISTLSSFGYNIIKAYKEEVENFLKDPQIDLVLINSDPGSEMDDNQLAKQILQQRDMPVLFLISAIEQKSISILCNNTGCGYVFKGVGDFVLYSSLEMAFQLFDAQKKVSDIEKCCRTLSDHVPPPGIFQIDAQGNYTYVNEEWSKIIDSKQAELAIR
jgi:AmiR/NasT family two-component response regulator